MKRFRNILLVMEATNASPNAVQAATELAVTNSAELTVLVVLQELPGYLQRLAPPSLIASKDLEVENFMAALTKTFSDKVNVTIKKVKGKPFVEVIREVFKYRIDLVIKSADPESGLRALLLGATDIHILRKCPCPVWLVKEGTDFKIERILAAVDFSEIDPQSDKGSEPLNRKILELSGSLSQRHDAELHVVHAWEAIGEDLMKSTRVHSTDEEIETYLKANRELHETWLGQLLEKAQDWMPEQDFSRTSTKRHLPKGDAGTELPRVAKEIKADLIVMGTLARTGLPGVLMGNTAETVLNAIECSVLAIKPDGFKSPLRFS
ncbi:MAG: hypothetical protein EP340_06225 [Alphaproteobacteria bacterium]|nr:MAG: hypothetical protein EP340_06225 [Alphaproteobacteria bacterium]